jgi:hypothetical protein
VSEPGAGVVHHTGPSAEIRISDTEKASRRSLFFRSTSTEIVSLGAERSRSHRPASAVAVWEEARNIGLSD